MSEQECHRSIPITSYGIILFSRNESGNIVFLLGQRRDSYAYIEFIRGTYHHRNSLYYLFSQMTPDEVKRIKEHKHKFDTLWEDLWVNHEGRLFHYGYARASRSFNNAMIQLDEILGRIEPGIKEPQWGFPKGKKHKEETEIECALREFQEEFFQEICLLQILYLPFSIHFLFQHKLLI